MSSRRDETRVMIGVRADGGEPLPNAEGESRAGALASDRGGQPVRSVSVAPSFPERPLRELLSGVAGATSLGDDGTTVRALAYRTDDVERGSLFFCVPGSRTDGHDHAPEAVTRGASALVVDHGLALGVAQAIVPSVREAMGPVSAAFYGNPSASMRVVGVTGTNGKTTTTYLLEAVLRAGGRSPGVIGTTGIRLDGRVVPFPRTTPEAPDLHRLLAELRDAGVDAIAMEVSSHGLDQQRVGGVRFAVAVFTNLTQDHLDYHPSMDAYFDAKATLFTAGYSDRAVVNIDHDAGRRLVERIGDELPILTYGVVEDADVRARDVEATADGIAFTVDGTRVGSPLRGWFNVENALAALAAGRALGIDDADAAEAIGAVPGVPGRVEPVDAGQDFLVLVDYAHTPDSVENVLRSARPLARGRVIVVLGCGGDRDRAKRPLMGGAATANADLAILTSDNPRSEDPLAILAEMEPGAREGRGAYEIEPDRRTAIRSAVSRARAGDVVVIAGKGHEPYQELADRTIAFDDRVVAAEELEALREVPS
jgi:UDP-N-acetylmuramoyl-L-alanyl-D-glutamate--2,6-diaminopimelate ligase